MPSRSTGTVKATISASPSPKNPPRSECARPFWLEAYGGRRYLVERVKLALPIDVPHLVVAWFGTIQPERLAQVMSDADDGLLARFSWVGQIRYRSTSEWTRRTRSSPSGRLIGLRLLEMRRGNDGKLAPVGVPLCPGAQSRLVEFGRLMQRRKELTEGLLRSTYGKARGCAAAGSGFRIPLVVCPRRDRGATEQHLRRGDESRGRVGMRLLNSDERPNLWRRRLQ